MRDSQPKVLAWTVVAQGDFVSGGGFGFAWLGYFITYCDVLKLEGEMEAGGVSVSLPPSDASTVSWLL